MIFVKLNGHMVLNMWHFVYQLKKIYEYVQELLNVSNYLLIVKI
jgi:hypothetical protein